MIVQSRSPSYDDGVLELDFYAWDLSGFGADLGYRGSSFCWSMERWSLLRAELDAAFFHLYGCDRDDVNCVMDTCPFVARNDEKTHGEYVTKRVVLERYDALANAAESGEPCRTVLAPPPPILRLPILGAEPDLHVHQKLGLARVYLSLETAHVP